MAKRQPPRPPRRAVTRTSATPPPASPFAPPFAPAVSAGPLAPPLPQPMQALTAPQAGVPPMLSGPRRPLPTGGAPVDLTRARQAPPDTLAPPAGDQTPEQNAQEEARKQKLHRVAIDKFQLANDATSDQRRRELEALTFELDQWPEEYRKERAEHAGPDGRVIPARPCLEINKLDQPIEQVLSEARQTQLAIQIKARGEGSSKEVAYVRQGMIRMIDQDSRGHIARHWALNRAAKCGFGAYRINKRYANDGDNDLDLVIDRILNQHSVYLDPFAIQPDWSDGEWGFLTSDLAETEFQRRFPNAILSTADADTLKGLGDASPGWITTAKTGKVFRVAEHYYVTSINRDRAYVTAGTAPGWRWVDELTIPELSLIQPNSTRPVKVRKVMWCLLDAAQILDEEEWDGRYIPIIPVIGKEYNVNGKRIWKGIISNAMDAQRSYNVMRSRQLEAIGLASLSTWVMAEGQDEGYEDQWDRANTSAFTRMIYKPTTLDGQLAPPPHRDVAEPAIMAITQGVREADGDIKATTGRFDPSLGRPGAERSGRAINALKLQGEVGTSIYLDNLATMSMPYEGLVLNDLLEYVYDRPGRVVRIIGDEDEEQDVMINQPYAEAGDDENKQLTELPFGPDDRRFNSDQGHKYYDLSGGSQYRVVVTVGPSAPTQQEADKAFMSDVAQAAPSLVPVFADLWIRASGSKVASQIADRIKRNSPFAKGDDESKKVKIPPEIQMQMQQMQQRLEKASQVVAGLQKQIDTDDAKAKGAFVTKQAELRVQERIARLEVAKDLTIERAKLEAAHAGVILDAAIERFAAREDQQFDADQAREMALLESFLTPPPSVGGGPEAEA